MFFIFKTLYVLTLTIHKRVIHLSGRGIPEEADGGFGTEFKLVEEEN